MFREEKNLFLRRFWLLAICVLLIGCSRPTDKELMKSGFSESTLRIIGLLSLAYSSGYLTAYLARSFFPSVRRAGENAEWQRAAEEAHRQTAMGGRVEYRRWSDNALMWTEPLDASHFTTRKSAETSGESWVGSLEMLSALLALAFGPLLGHFSPSKINVLWLAVSGVAGAVGTAVGLYFLRGIRQMFHLHRELDELRYKIAQAENAFMPLPRFHDLHNFDDDISPLFAAWPTLLSAIVLGCFGAYFVFKTHPPSGAVSEWLVGILGVIFYSHICLYSWVRKMNTDIL